MTKRTVRGFQEDFSERFRREVEEYDNCMLKDIWYAAYGSNVSEERFLEYIRNCLDKENPKESRTYMFPYDIFFAGRGSVRWNRMGTAFLDDTKPGRAFGRIYRIGMTQFREIQAMEGNAYQKKLLLGMVKQDGRSVAARTAWNAREAVYYTSKEKRTVVDLLLLEVR